MCWIAIIFVIFVAVITLGNFGNRFFLGARFFKIKIGQCDFTCGHARGLTPVENVIFSAAIFAFFEMKIKGRFARGRFVRADTVCQHHLQFLSVLNKKVINALFFHETADKIKIGLVVLNTIGTRFIRACGFFLYVGPKAIILQHFLKDFQYGLFLENAVFGCAGQEPKPRADFGYEMRHALIDAHIFGRNTNTRKITVFVIGIFLNQRNF